MFGGITYILRKWRLAKAIDLDRSTRAPGRVIASNGDDSGHIYADPQSGPPGATGDQGPQGEPGTDGADGASAYEIAVADGFVGNESAWLASLKGETGDEGPAGETGPQGDQGPQGAQGDQGPTGETGPKGDPGAPGPQGDIGEEGPQGEPGTDGADGASAYETAVAGGFVGNEATWLASLKGETGDEGPTGETGPKGDTGDQGPQGDVGADGADGASAYEIAVAGGFVGNESAWLASLKGETGDQGPAGDEGPQGETGDVGPNTVSSATSTDLTGFLVGNGSHVSATSIALSQISGTASRAVEVSSGGTLQASATTAAELAYLSGVTSGLQSQLNAKASLAGASFTGQVIVTGGVSGTQTQLISSITGGFNFQLNNTSTGGRVYRLIAASNAYGTGGSRLLLLDNSTTSTDSFLTLYYNGTTTMMGLGVGNYTPTAVLDILGDSRFRGPVRLNSYTVSTLPTTGVSACSIAYASNGRKSGEGSGSGTGVPVWYDGTNWKTNYDNSTVAA